MESTDHKAGSVYLWILSYLRPYAGKVIVFVMAGIVATLVDLFTPKVLQYIIDTVLPDRDQRLLGYTVLLLVGMTIVMFLLNAYRNMAQRVIAENASNDLQLSIFSKLRELGFSYFEKNPVGRTLSLFQVDVPSVARIYNFYIPKMVRVVLLLVIAAIFLLTIDWKLGLLCMSTSLAYYTVGPRFERKAKLYGDRLRKERTTYTQLLHNSMSGMMELRGYGAEQWNLDNLADKLLEVNRTRLRFSLMAALQTAVRYITVNLGLLCLFIAGIVSVQQHTLTVGEFVAMTFYCFRVMGELTSVVKMYTEQRILMVQAANLYGFLKLEPDVKDAGGSIVGLSALKGAIQLDRVSFGYPGQASLLQDLSLDIRPGERVALVGTSGNGKTTILKLLNRFYDIHSGSITYDGIPIGQIPLTFLRRQIGYVFQETYLFGGTIRENIVFGNPEADESNMVTAAKAAFAHDFIMELPDGYDTVVGERGVRLSGGQKQRIAIARMFIKQPAIIFLDEATSALDNVSEREVKHALDRLLKGRTTITVAHRLSSVKDYDLIAVIGDGRVLESGTYDELVSRKQHLYQLVEGEMAG